MKYTGIIRKIDDLGRIVIPKEIRKSLNITNNDELDIFVENEKIILKKYERLLNVKDISLSLLELIKKYIEFNIAITDNNKILASTLKSINENEELSRDLKEKIMLRKLIQSEEKTSIKLTSLIELNVFYIIAPIIIDGNIHGSIFSFSEKRDDNMGLIVRIILDLIKSKL